MLLIDDLRVDIRPYAEPDAPFVFDSWLDSFRAAHAAGVIPNDRYRPWYSEVLRRLAARETVRILVAYNADFPAVGPESQLLSHLCYELGEGILTVHYAFTKDFCRRRGLARALMAVAGIDPRKPFLYSFKSPRAKDIARSWTGARFDPIPTRKALSLDPQGKDHPVPPRRR